MVAILCNVLYNGVNFLLVIQQHIHQLRYSCKALIPADISTWFIGSSSSRNICSGCILWPSRIMNYLFVFPHSVSLHWAMIKCSLAQELMMSNSLSRPPCDHSSGPSWLSGAPWTPWELWPRWLPTSIPVSPAEPIGKPTSNSGPTTDLFCSRYKHVGMQSGLFLFVLGLF